MGSRIDFPGKGRSRPPPKPRGGKRPGAGRPRGSRNALPAGAVGALRALRFRVPKDIAPELADAAGEALETVVKVMRGKVKRGAIASLTAARVLREEICGPIPKQVQVAGSVVFRIEEDA